MNKTLTAIEGIKVGHWSNLEARTGCTVVLCPPEGCVASGLALGSAPGSREYALLAPEKSVERVHAILLTGGSAFGLAAATGVMEWLEQHNIGFESPVARIPIVPSAVIFDLIAGDASVRPTAQNGFEAAQNASTEPVQMGQIGVGTGALVGKYLGLEYAAKGGLGSASLNIESVTIAALVVTNAVGDIYDKNGQLMAGSSHPDRTNPSLKPNVSEGTNTTLVVVATDATITKAQARALSTSAHIGVAQVTRPSHTVHDGDTCFVLSTGSKEAISMMALSVAVQQVVSEAILNGVKASNN